MLDLKAKLAAAGLVTADEVAAAERKRPRGQDRKASPGDRGPDRGPSSGNERGGQPRNEHATQAGTDRGPRNDGPRTGPRNDRGPRNDGPNHGPRTGPRNDGPRTGAPAGAQRPGLDVAALKRGGKGEAYDAIRRVVDRGRLDAAHGIPGEHAEPFHFTTATGQLSRLVLEPEARTMLTEGSAGLIAFMSHHGLAHCVVPRPLAEAVHAVFPLWLRVLKDHPGAGQHEPPRPPPEPRPTADASPTDASPADASTDSSVADPSIADPSSTD